jgi:hypothetical protein
MFIVALEFELTQFKRQRQTIYNVASPFVDRSIMDEEKEIEFMSKKFEKKT